MNKSANPEKIRKQLFSKDDLSHIKCRYKIIGRLISIKGLCTSSYSNILIQVEL